MKTLILVSAIVMLFANIATAEPTIESPGNNLTNWEEIYTDSDEDTIRIVLKNPYGGEYLYALVELGHEGIRYFILVGRDLKLMANVGGTFEEVEMSKEAKEGVWTFLRDQLGIRTI